MGLKVRTLVVFFVLLVVSAGAFGQGMVAPKAPVFTDSERQGELARRRQAVVKKMGPNSVMMLFSAEPKIYAYDVDFMYRQENNHYYLTALKQAGSTLVLINDGETTTELLFLPKRNPQFEAWNGKMYSNEDATRLSGVKTVIDAAELESLKQALKNKQEFKSKAGDVTVSLNKDKLFLLLPNGERDRNGAREYRQENEFSKTLTGHSIQNALPIFGELRLVKSPYELKILQHAIDITAEAQTRSMLMVGGANWEYEVQAEVEYTFRRRNADYWGYPSIVGCGPNATTLHYVESQSQVKRGDLMLMDVGAEYDHYTADVTRTYPVSGKFTKEQKEIYQIVYDAQEAVAAVTKPGVRFSVLSQAADKVIKDGLTKLGLITSPDGTYETKTANGQTVKLPQYRLWYLHGLGHWLGMNVHDVGDYSTPLKPGMVFTNEPGIYIREDMLDRVQSSEANDAFLAKVRPVFEKYKNIGVRIEDDMLVTDTGVDWMTKRLPRKIDDIERYMKNAKKPGKVSSAVFNSGASSFAGFESTFAGVVPQGLTARRSMTSDRAVHYH